MNIKKKTEELQNDNPTTASSGELLFIKCVKDGIPNRDPLRDSDARRLFGEDDGRISLSDVSIKRDVRDFVLAKYPEGSDDKNRFIFAQKKFNEAHTSLLGRDGLANEILSKLSFDNKAEETDAEESPGNKKSKKKPAKEKNELEAKLNQKRLLKAAFDMRVFGAVFSVTGKSFNQTGPVQFGWAHSLHPVETRYTQGTVVMPSKEAPIPEESKAGDEGDEEKGKTQGTIWTQYHLPFAIFAMPAVINSTIADQTGMTERDTELLLEALWKGTLSRQARGRGIQQPIFLCHIKYNDPFFRIGFLDELVSVKPKGKTSDTFSLQNQPTKLSDVQIDLSQLAESLECYKDKIESVSIWAAPNAQLTGENVSNDKVGGFTVSKGTPEESKETN